MYMYVYMLVPEDLRRMSDPLGLESMGVRDPSDMGARVWACREAISAVDY